MIGKLALVIALVVFCSLQAQEFQWAVCSGENNTIFSVYNKGKSVTTDEQGNVYVVGEFSDTLRFGATLLKSFVTRNAFIVKYDNTGEVQWADVFGSISSIYWDDILKQSSVTDDAGNTFISLSLTGKGKVGGVEYSAGGYIIKYTTNGTVDWVKKNEKVNGFSIITFDSQGNLIISGLAGAYFKIAKFTKDGDFLMEKADNAGMISAPTSMTVDGSDNIYITGGCPMFAGNISGTEIAVGNYYLAKYNSALEFQWAQTSSGSGSEAGVSVQTDQAGNVYVTGAQRDATYAAVDANYSGRDVLNANNFLLKYDSGGVIQWAKGFTAFSVKDMTTDANGNNYITGWFQIVSYFETDSVYENTSPLGTTFIVKYDAAGQLGWLTGIYGRNSQEAFGITRDKSNNLLVTGQFIGEGIFGSDTLRQEAKIGVYGFVFITRLSSGATDIADNEYLCIPQTAYLNQNYPNPFNPSTVISYQILAASRINVSIYDGLGKRVRTLINEKQSAGSYSIPWNGKNDLGLPVVSGIYFCNLWIENNSSLTKKMILTK
jgi:hypothetical protein